MIEAARIIRFWNKVDKDGPIHPVYGQCWIWTKCRNKRGYGRTAFKHGTELAHRYAWEITFGIIPEAILVCHGCDNPVCVNPDHLFLGIPADNTMDSKVKNRLAFGERVGTCVLTEAQVMEIKKRYEVRKRNHGNGRALAREFGVSRSTIQMIVNGKNWKHL